MGELGALRMLMELNAFDKIPLEGDISYRDLADAVGAEETLVSKCREDTNLKLSLLTQADRFCWMLVATGILQQNGEDRVAHTRFSKIYVDNNPQGAFFRIM